MVVVAVVVAAVAVVVEDPVLPMPVLLRCTGVPVAVPFHGSLPTERAPTFFHRNTGHRYYYTRPNYPLASFSLSREEFRICVYI